MAEYLSRQLGFDPAKKLPEFLNTRHKWDNAIADIDTFQKFDELALKILNCEGMDTFLFRDLINDLAFDVKKLYPETGHIITDLTKSVNILADAMMKTILDIGTTMMDSGMKKKEKEVEEEDEKKMKKE